MLVRFLFLLLLLPGGAAAQNDTVSYRVETPGMPGGALGETIRASMQLFTLADRPPASVAALRRRTEGDVDRIAAALRSEGHYAHQIEYRIDTRARPAEVTIEIDPGPRYELTRFDIRYVDEAPPDSRIEDPARIGVGLPQPARSRVVVDGAAALVRALGERGFPLAERVGLEPVVDHDSQTMSVTVTVRSGPRVAFGPLSVRGADSVREDYVRRVAALPEDAVFDLSAVDAARRRLFGTGLFEAVGFSWDQEPVGDRLPLTVEVVEADHRTIALGLSYSTTEGPGVEASWTHRNLLGRDEEIVVGARASPIRQRFGIDFVKPNYQRLDQNLRAATELRRSRTDAFNEQALTGEVGLERPLATNLTGFAGVSAELARIDDRERGESRDLIFGVPLRLVYDSTDNPLDPSRGIRGQVEATPSHAIGDSDVSFVRSQLTAATYYELIGDRRLILAGRTRIGAIFGGQRGRIPASRRFFAGGGGSIRGFGFQKAGPVDVAGAPIGGLSVLEVGAEARIRVFGDFGIVPFADGGTAFEKSFPDGRDMLWAAGLGLRYHTAVGPVRLDVAVPLNRRRGVDRGYQFYVSLGQAF